MMEWKVLLSPNVQKFLEKADKFIADRIRKGLDKLKTDNPFTVLEHFEDKDYYKLRIGEYRALIDIDFRNKLIIVRVLDNRGVIYKRKH